MGCGASKIHPSPPIQKQPSFLVPSVDPLLSNSTTLQALSSSTTEKSHSSHTRVSTKHHIAIKRISEAYQVDASTGSLVEKIPVRGQGIHLIDADERRPSISSAYDTQDSFMSTSGFSVANGNTMGDKSDSSLFRDKDGLNKSSGSQGKQKSSGKSALSLIYISPPQQGTLITAAPREDSQKRPRHLAPLHASPKQSLHHAKSDGNTKNIGIVPGRPLGQPPQGPIPANEGPFRFDRGFLGANLTPSSRSSYLTRRHSDIPPHLLSQNDKSFGPNTALYPKEIAVSSATDPKESTEISSTSEYSYIGTQASISTQLQPTVVSDYSVPYTTPNAPVHKGNIPTIPSITTTHYVSQTQIPHRYDHTDEKILDSIMAMDTDEAIEKALAMIQVKPGQTSHSSISSRIQ